MPNPTYRYRVTDDGSIYRGQIMRTGHDESWSDYWDGDGMVGFTVDWHYGSQHLTPLHKDEANERAMTAFRLGQGTDSLDRLAPRLANNEDACFLHVPLDRGTDFYVLAYSGDPDGKFRAEVEAVWNSEVYRIEEDKYLPGAGIWREWDVTGDEHYGMSEAESAFEKEFPLAEFPAEMFVGSDQ